MRIAAAARTESDLKVVSDFIKAVSNLERPHHDWTIDAAAGHFSGYLARQVVNRVAGQLCQDVIVDRERTYIAEFERSNLSLVPENFTAMTKLIDRGGLLYPTMSICHITIAALDV